MEKLRRIEALHARPGSEGERHAAERARERIQALINALVADGLAASTVRAAIAALHRALVPAIDAGLVVPLVFQRLSLPRLVVKPKLVIARIPDGE